MLHHKLTYTAEKKIFSQHYFFIPIVFKILSLSIVVVSCVTTCNTNSVLLLKYGHIWYPYIRLKWPSFPSSPSPHENTFPSTVNAIACRPPKSVNINLNFQAGIRSSKNLRNLTLLHIYSVIVWAFQPNICYLFSWSY